MPFDSSGNRESFSQGSNYEHRADPDLRDTILPIHKTIERILEDTAFLVSEAAKFEEKVRMNRGTAAPGDEITQLNINGVAFSPDNYDQGYMGTTGDRAQIDRLNGTNLAFLQTAGRSFDKYNPTETIGR